MVGLRESFPGEIDLKLAQILLIDLNLELLDAKAMVIAFACMTSLNTPMYEYVRVFHNLSHTSHLFFE